MKISLQLFLLIMLSAQAAAVTAADSSTSSGQGSVDTSQWECKFCTFEQGLSGTLDVGLGDVSKDSYKFGEYTGLNEQGGFLIGNAAARFRGKDADYWNVSASNLGLDSRSLSAESGRQGKYKVFLKYDELPHFISDSAVTPFVGTGGGSLTLPLGWVKAASPGGMTALTGSLHQADLDTMRKNLAVGASLMPAPEWEYAVNFRHDTREGTKRIAGTFFLNSAQLVQPIDYVTNQLDASASYTGRKWQARIAYYASVFNNDKKSLTWENPYTSAPGMTGQLALPPDNQFHQILATAGYQFSDKTRVTADIAVGRMTQNDDFLPATTISSLAEPRNSLEGKVNTLNANFKLTSVLTDKLRLNAAYAYNDRDNKTAQAAFPWVTTDGTVNPARTNLPYSFTQSLLKLSADYQVVKDIRTSIGVDNDSHQRTFQAVDKTDEHTVWGKVSARNRDNIDLMLKVAHADRNKSGDNTVPGLTPTDNPLMTKYNLASRVRNSTGFRVDVPASETVNVGLGLDYSKDSYSKSAIGLASSESFGFNGDVSVMFTKQTSMHFFLNHEEISSKQAGSGILSSPDWSAENNDMTDVFGIGVKHALIKDKLDVGADYTTSNSRGGIIVTASATDSLFPDLVSRLNIFKLYATYRLKDSMSLQGTYWHERYSSQNWMLDGVTPSTISNVLVLGEQPPSYSVNVIMLSARYNF